MHALKGLVLKNLVAGPEAVCFTPSKPDASSQQNPMKNYQDAFISYGRADSKQFAIHLHQRLTDQGYNIWLDQNDIPLGVDFQNQIDAGITTSDNFLFIIAPHAVNSPYCLKEIEAAVQLNKRIIPLLHVEQIDQATWQQRYPNKPLEAWEEYQAKGLHSSFGNLHPAIARINWVYFREGIDDFEKSLAGLVEIFSRQKDYVRQHTQLLVKAQEWEQYQRQSSYLLVGEARAAAEAWLRTRFDQEQPPCEPTDLHCEYICESTKNADNLMTDVFLSFAEADGATMQRLARHLQRQAFTLWRRQSDVASGDEYQEQMNRGIEEATNIVFLMSSVSVKSPLCLGEIAYAASLKKRIIPIQLAAISANEIPAALQGIQTIALDLSQDEAAYPKKVADLIRVLRQDATYYEQRKILLSKALKWKRQKYNPSILLRGRNLQQAQAWLEAARNHPQNPPIPILEEFITASTQLPPDTALDAFLCYSRSDVDFARKLNSGLQIQGKTTWFDQELISGTTQAQSDGSLDFQAEVAKGIEQANNFLIILSANSVYSTRCLGQLEQAQKLGKRLVPLLLQDMETAILPPALVKVPWVDFRKHGGDFFTNFGELTRSLDADPEHVRQHTRLLLKALEWEREGKDDDYLLRGKELPLATNWLGQAPGKEPPPTDLQRLYIQQSEALPHRTLKPVTAAFTSLVAGVMVCLLRWGGLLQAGEIAAYDQLLRSRPSEPPDSRITVVAVDEISIQMLNDRYEPGRGTLPDPALDDLLRLLHQHRPQLIGLDFIRDYPAQPGLAKRLQQIPNLMGVCQLGVEEGNISSSSLRPMPELPPERVGFANLVSDRGSYIRRQNLIQAPDGANCNTLEAFGLLLTRQYLEKLGIAYTSPLDENNELTKVMKFGNVLVPSLWDGTAYGQNQVAGGYQAMVNYRTPGGDASKFATVVSVRDVLTNQVDPNFIRDRIVLIGYTATTIAKADYFNTPYGGMPGVMVHGQMVSQLISAVLDGRPLIWWLPRWGETLWIFAWTTLGGLIGWRSPRLLVLLVALGGTAVLLYLCCFILLTATGGWLPLLPAALALFAASFGVGFLTYRLRH